MSDSEILVKVENVSKKFCRSLKKSLWYGVKDMAGELNPFGRGFAADGRSKIEVGARGVEGRSKIEDGNSKPQLPTSISELQPTAPISNLQTPAAGPSPISQLLSSSPRATARDESLRADEFYAVRDVSFELKRGECLGLIGRNGAGKTTLLKMLNGLIKPDAGCIEMRGRVGALIALGAGFNPILTGRENIYVNGSVLGLTKREIEEKIEEIIDFADIREFIDSPVQSYSSGMQVRLGFAVATALDPDVLILDEVLAVGDASFRHKCYHRLNRLIKNSAVILVSHSMDYIATLSTSVGMMQRGDLHSFRDVIEGIAAYEEANRNKPTTESDGGNVFAFYPPITSARLQIVNPAISFGEALNVRVELQCAEAIRNAEMSFSAVNQSEQYVMACSSSRQDRKMDLPVGSSILRFKIDPLLLHDGDYRWNFSIRRQGSIEHLVWAMRAGEFSVRSPYKGVGNIPYLPPMGALEVVS